MKKWIAGFMALLLFLAGAAAAFAEDKQITEINWEPMEAAVYEAEMEGAYVVLNPAGVAVWIPNVFLNAYAGALEKAAEAADTSAEAAEAEETLVAVFGPESDNCLIEVLIPKLPADTTVESVLQLLADKDEFLKERVNVNGLDGIYLEDNAGTSAALWVMTAPGHFVEFRFYEVDNKGYQAVYRIILSSVQPVGLGDE